MGQEHVTRTLVNAIEQGKISHAYLFAGSRGTGKTSTAKLLAKALTACRARPRVLRVCESCVAISAGTRRRHQMDAASTAASTDIRDIPRQGRFSPRSRASTRSTSSMRRNTCSPGGV